MASMAASLVASALTNLEAKLCRMMSFDCCRVQTLKVWVVEWEDPSFNDLSRPSTCGKPEICKVPERQSL